MGNLIAIVGRPNVGKSTLFNRLTRSRAAIVSDEAGTTRDRQYGLVEWCGHEFSIIDTGGWVEGGSDIFDDEIRRQVSLACEEADLILFLVDVGSGITDLDARLASLLRSSAKRVFVVVNKVDNNEQRYGAAEFYALGLGEPYCLSSLSGSGTGDLLDAVVEALPAEQEAAGDGQLPRFAIAGRPNVGKSSLLNALIGEERNIVTSIAGTTRDSIHTHYNKFGFDFLLVDTAGIRRKTKVDEGVEFYSVMRSIRSIENADVCILIIDALRGIEGQDMNICQLILRNKKGLVVFVNKWDALEERSNKVIKSYENAIRERLAPFTDFPIIFGSARVGGLTPTGATKNLYRVLEAAKRVYENRSRRIGTTKLNQYMLPLIEAYPPPSMKGKYIKIKYCSQIPDTRIPSFVFYANLPQYVKEPYYRFLENKIREEWDFHGTPINIFVRSK